MTILDIMGLHFGESEIGRTFRQFFCLMQLEHSLHHSMLCQCWKHNGEGTSG